MANASVVNIFNVAITELNTWIPFTFPQLTQSITFQCREFVEYYFSTDLSKPDYFTFKKGSGYWESNISTSKTVWFKSLTTPITIEIITWSMYI